MTIMGHTARVGWLELLLKY